MTPPLYRLRGLVKGYNRNFQLDIDQLDIPQGCIYALLGPNGAGKSTLLRVLHFLEPVQAGEIEFEGQAIPFPATLALRRRVAMVFQKPVMLSGTVHQNVGYGMRLRHDVDPQRVERLLQALDLTHLAHVSARTLSGGEAQRVAVARALATEPEVLLLDEPTANLDPYNIRLIEHIIRQSATQQRTSIILVTHDVFQVRRLADFAAFILAGKLVEVAAIEAFFEKPTDPRTQAYLRGELLT